ncbi:MAG: hypothetical protein DI585_05275 [Pseudomonas fluorescens]|nr:MAG: hypothetical protein DI585_05275 [Pseudomonas fluorescens]
MLIAPDKDTDGQGKGEHGQSQCEAQITAAQTGGLGRGTRVSGGHGCKSIRGLRAVKGHICVRALWAFRFTKGVWRLRTILAGQKDVDQQGENTDDRHGDKAEQLDNDDAALWAGGEQRHTKRLRL